MTDQDCDDSCYQIEMTYGEHLVAALAAQRSLQIEEVTINPAHQAIIGPAGPFRYHSSRVYLATTAYVYCQ